MEMRQEPQQTMLMRLALWLRLLLTSTDFQATEAQSGLIAIGLGLSLLNPYVETFQTFNSTVFESMAQLAPEWVWGLILFWSGFVQIVVMFKRVHWRRRIGMFVLSCLWAFLAVMLGLSDPSGWGLVIFGVLAASSGWAYWRLSLRS